mgnify:FL=1
MNSFIPQQIITSIPNAQFLVYQPPSQQYVQLPLSPQINLISTPATTAISAIPIVPISGNNIIEIANNGCKDSTTQLNTYYANNNNNYIVNNPNDISLKYALITDNILSSKFR